VRTEASNRQGDPDPQHFEHYCRVIVPRILAEVCQLDAELARQVGEDILARAESFAALDDTAQDVLRTPFAEEVADYQPEDSSLALKGAVAVVVRSSMLEEAHSRGPVDGGGITGITTMAAAPLSHFLAARHLTPVPVERNVFAGLAGAWPRAWACLDAAALAYGAGGGRWPYRAPAAPVPRLPVAEVDAPKAVGRDDAIVLSGVDSRFERPLVDRMREVAETGAVWAVASLSRISRHLDKLLQVLEYLLAHGIPILTANYLLRPQDAWVRRGELARVDHHDPLAAWRVSRGLSGVHRAVVAEVVKEKESNEQTASP
jgi:hypothetical protein